MSVLRRIPARRVLLALCAAALLSVFTASPASALLNGVADDQHPYVGIVFTFDELCSGSAVSPTVVVTAAHCLETGNRLSVSFAQRPAQEADGWPAGSPGRPSSPGVVMGTGYDIGGYCGPEVPGNTCHPGAPGYVDTYDVAVVVLDTPVSLPRYAVLPQPGMVDTLANQTPLTDSGYGVDTRTNGTGTGHPILISHVTRRTGTTLLQQANARGADKYLRIKTTSNVQLCFGDSGGPTLLGDTLLGVHSFGKNNNCAGGIAESTRIDTAPILAAIRSYM